MRKALFSTLILFITIVLGIIFINMVFNRYPEWGTFYNLLWLGLTLFGIGIGIFIAAHLLEKSIQESR